MPTLLTRLFLLLPLALVAAAGLAHAQHWRRPGWGVHAGSAHLLFDGVPNENGAGIGGDVRLRVWPNTWLFAGIDIAHVASNDAAVTAQRIIVEDLGARVRIRESARYVATIELAVTRRLLRQRAGFVNSVDSAATVTLDKSGISLSQGAMVAFRPQKQLRIELRGRRTGGRLSRMRVDSRREASYEAQELVSLRFDLGLLWTP